MSISLENAIENAKNIVLNTRDFCGNEKEAAIDSLKEDGIKPTSEILAIIASQTNSAWAKSQTMAGVKKKYHSHGSSFQQH